MKYEPDCDLAKVSMPKLTFMNSVYTLASHNEKNNHPMWEFTTGGEPIDQWNSLVTLIDRPEAKTMEEMDRLSQGIMEVYTTHGGKVLKAQTFQDTSGKPFNYMVAAFDEPQAHRFELNFVKIATGPQHAYTAIYGVRITDPQDYVGKANKFLNEHSAEIGHALGEAKFPALDTLPRKEF
jgi:hypothetical protein